MKKEYNIVLTTNSDQEFLLTLDKDAATADYRPLQRSTQDLEYVRKGEFYVRFPVVRCTMTRDYTVHENNRYRLRLYNEWLHIGKKKFAAYPPPKSSMNCVRYTLLDKSKAPLIGNAYYENHWAFTRAAAGSKLSGTKRMQAPDHGHPPSAPSVIFDAVGYIKVTVCKTIRVLG